MLYLLRQPLDTGTRFVPIADATAARLEVALLSCEAEERRSIVAEANARDPFLASWICSEANGHGPVGWLCDGLSTKLALAMDRTSCRRVPAADARYYASVAESAGTTSHELLDCCPVDPLPARQLPAFAPVPPRVGHDVRFAANTQWAWLVEEIHGLESRLPPLVHRLAHMESALADFDRRLEQEKLASLKQFAYGASHEINNPLANIAARAQTLQRDEKDHGRRSKLSAIFDQAMRAHEMIADLMLFADPPTPDYEEVEIVSLVAGLVAEFAGAAAKAEIVLTLECVYDSLVAEADPTQLAVAVRAIITNALEAVGDGGQIALTVDGDAGELWLTVRDDGPGITDEVRHHLLDPFYSGREAGRGLGFGLSKCWRIVNEHGGSVEVSGVDPHGAEFTIRLPKVCSHARAA